VDNLQNPSPPNLPLAPREYESRYHEANNNALRLYFNRLSGNLQSLFGPNGGRFLALPFGAWSSESDQVAVSTTAAYAITFDVADIVDSVYLVSGLE
jgi:uncharacterized membrane protein YfcA